MMAVRGRLWCGILLMGLGNSVPIQAANLLFVAQPNNPGFDDELVEYLEERHTVIRIDSADPELAAAAAEADVVYVAESIGSGTIDPNFEGTVFRDVPTPVIIAEVFAWDNAYFTGDVIHEHFGNTGRPESEVADETFIELLDSIYITDATHPMAAGLSGKVKVFDEPFSLNFGLIASMGSDVDVIATADEAGAFATSFVYEPGDMLTDGTPAAGRRIGIYLGQGSALPTPPGPLLLMEYISPDGFKLLDAAINYALDTGLPGDFDGNGTLEAADIDALSAAVLGGSTDAKYDLDANGSVGDADRTVWVEQLKRTYFGDSNLDGEFSSGDFVVVFTAGEYEDGTAGNSGWGEGDWNGNGDFDSSDFVTAFVGGGFEIGPRAAVAAVPEPATSTLALLAYLGQLAWLRCRTR